MRLASVWHGKDGYTLRVHDVKFRYWLEEEVTNFFCRASHGYVCPLCICNKPLFQWVWKIGWKRDQDGVLDYSLGRLLFILGQRSQWKDAKELYEHPLTFEEVCERFPDSRAEDDDDGVDYVRGVMIND